MFKNTPSVSGLLGCLLLLPVLVSAQETIRLDDLSAWKPTGQKNWQIAGDVSADLFVPDKMTATKGAGVLLNLPDEKNRANLLSVGEYGDVDVSFDFMMAQHSNSGFYLQGRYEVQLLDSWGVKNPRYGDCGGIYARRRFVPEEQMFEGNPPRQNACLAPGLWQHMDISFQAPRFDADGKKTANARILKVVLNGVLVQENVELTGPTGGPISEQEAAQGPFMIQGDHGPVAFRNFALTNRSGAPPAIGPISWKAWAGAFRTTNEFLTKKPEKEGTLAQFTWEIAGSKNDFAVEYKTTLKAPVAGKYLFSTRVGGRSILKVNGKEILADAWTSTGDQRDATIELPAGDIPVELTTYKMDEWMAPMLSFVVQGPGAPAVAFQTMSSTLSLTPRDPIYLDATEPTVFRSFMDFYPDGKFKKRIVHAVQVGDPALVHYTYDLDNGALAQIWKGDFLLASPMWDDRGDGSSRPRGAVLPLYDVAPVVAKSALFDTTSSKFSPVSDYRPKGYDLDERGAPVFRYQRFGMNVEDQIRVTDGKYLTRTLSFANAGAGADYVCRLATGREIIQVSETLYSIDGKRYYVQLPKGEKALLESAGGLSVLYVPLKAKVEYSVLW